MIRTPSRLDWQRVVLKTARAVGSQRKLAPLVGMSESALNALAIGDTRHPLFDNGIRLLALYSEHVEHVPGAQELAERVKP